MVWCARHLHPGVVSYVTQWKDAHISVDVRGWIDADESYHLHLWFFHLHLVAFICYGAIFWQQYCWNTPNKLLTGCIRHDIGFVDRLLVASPILFLFALRWNVSFGLSVLLVARRYTIDSAVSFIVFLSSSSIDQSKRVENHWHVSIVWWLAWSTPSLSLPMHRSAVIFLNSDALAGSLSVF